MNTTEQNVLIVEFMGFGLDEVEKVYWVDTEDKYGAKADELKYNSSWNEFMPVAEKVYEVIGPLMDGTNHESEDAIGDMSIAILDIDIEQANEYAIKAIVWYNGTKKK